MVSGANAPSGRPVRSAPVKIRDADPSRQVNRAAAAGLSTIAEAFKPLQMGGKLGLTAVICGQLGGVRGHSVADLKGKVGGRSADQCGQLIFGGNPVVVLNNRHGRRLAAAPDGGLRRPTADARDGQRERRACCGHSHRVPNSTPHLAAAAWR